MRLAHPNAACAVFVIGVAGDLFIGRIAFALGVALGLLAVLASVSGSRAARRQCCRWPAPPRARSPPRSSCSAQPPTGSCTARTARTAALGGPALLLTGAGALLLPEGGYEPFATTSLLAAGGASLCVLLFARARRRLLRATFALYLLALLGCYLVPSPVGSNAVRFGVLFAPPMLVGCVTIADVQTRAGVTGGSCSAGIAHTRIRDARDPPAAAPLRCC